MLLTPTELERLTIFSAAELARKRRAKGLKLNHPEAVAIITDEILEGAREGKSVADLMSLGSTILNTRDVMPGVAAMLPILQVEGVFPDGTKLVTVHEPIRAEAGAAPDTLEPGAIITVDGDIELAAGRPRKTLAVVNTGDRPVQIGSHYHFFEVNKALEFDRAASFGMRLDIPAGTAVRFEPGQSKEVALVGFGEGMIATPGAIDVHVHFDSAGLCEHAIASGITTMLGGSLGPITVGIDSGGPFNVGKMLQAAEHWPINFGFLGRGNSHKPASIVEQMETGCVGLKIHEDWGSMPATIDACLKVADDLDFQVQLHTDTLNESGFVEDTLAAIGGRAIHMYHTEGAGGGHAPDIIRVAGIANCLPSSTNPTNPYTVNTFDEHLDMTMVCHHLNPAIPEDVAFAESRIRAQTIAAEDVLHDIGAISMLGSDSQGMGRIHEVICRTWQLASKMKDQRGPLPQERAGFGDNARIRRFIAKYTINAARTFGIAEHIGSLEDGKMADVVVWRPAFFGIKPELVIKGGFIAWGAMGDSAASLMTCEPILMRPQWGAFGRAAPALSACFVHPLAIERGLKAELGLSKALLPARGTRKLKKSDMLWNDSCPNIRVDPQTFDVFVDGELATCEPAHVLPLAQRYMLR